MNDKIKLSKTTLAKLQPEPGKQLIFWDSDITGFGVRVSPGGSQTFFCQSRFKGKVVKYTIGQNSRITPEKARREAIRIQSNLALGIDPKPEVEKESRDSFGDLLSAYCDMLELAGKYSFKAVRSSLVKHVKLAHPNLWKKAANKITLDDCMDIVAEIKNAGMAREADKVRAYIRTAFSEAINARSDVNAIPAMRRMKLTQNPAREMRKVKGATQAKDRALSLSEFRAYWTRIQQQPEPRRSLAMLHIITGGQRQLQLARVTQADLDRDAMTITLLDPKGRREQPRRHTIPLLPEALELIDGITGGGDFIFSCNGGDTGMNIDYLNDIAKEVCADMEKAEELEGAAFTAGTIRATIETRLMKAPYRVSSDVLARLLSHGLGGIQARHYQHDSMHDEQLEALQMLWRMVNDIPEPGMRLAEVVRLEARA
jgi:integrase